MTESILFLYEVHFSFFLPPSSYRRQVSKKRTDPKTHTYPGRVSAWWLSVLVPTVRAHSLSWSHWSNRVLQQRTAAWLFYVWWLHDGTKKMLRLRSSSQLNVKSTHGTAGGRAWLKPSVCVRAIGTRCRRGVNRQGSEVEELASHAWAWKGCGRTDRQTGSQTYYLHLLIRTKERLSFTNCDK